MTDVSAHKLYETEVSQSQKLEALGRLAGGVAHDFNNLLTAIAGYAELLMGRTELVNPLRVYVSEIRRASEQGSALTHQLLAFSRQQAVTLRALNVNSVVADMDRMLRRLIGEDIALVTRLEPELGSVKADQAQMGQIIANLAINARDAMPRGGRLTIETANLSLDESYTRSHVGVTPGRYVMLAVSDTGCGMDKETQSHLFEPFFTTKEHGVGTGFGLATVYGIVKQSRGHIIVYTELGHGTTFKILLPTVHEIPATRDVLEGATVPFRGSETILLVEDSDGVRRVARQFLEANGYRVFEARHGHEAIAVFKRQKPNIDLVLSDVIMPRMGGPQLIKELRKIDARLRVVYMSGHTDAAIARYGISASDAHFLRKPFSSRELSCKVRVALTGS